MRSTESRQLPFVFADSPRGGGQDGPEDGSEGRAFLLHIAEARDAEGSVAPASDDGSLLERVASPSNLAEVQEHVSAGYDWIVSLDLSKFFDRVDHQRLLARLAHRVEDGRMLRLIHRILRAEVVMPTGERIVPDQGTPQGGPLWTR